MDFVKAFDGFDLDDDSILDAKIEANTGLQVQALIQHGYEHLAINP